MKEKYQLVIRDQDGKEQIITEGRFTSITVNTADKSYIEKWRDFIKNRKKRLNDFRNQ